MTTVSARNADRLRELLAYLVSTGAPTRKEELFDHVGQLFPPEGEDLDRVSNGSRRWVNDLFWKTTNLVKAGWLSKDNKGNWQATEMASPALDRFPEPSAFMAESWRLYGEWNRARKAETTRRAWLVRGSSVRGASVVLEWLQEGWVSVPASQLRQIEPGISAAELATAAEEDYDHLKHQERKSKVDEIVAFVTKMSVADIVLTTSEGRAFVGDLAGDWTWQISEGSRTNLRRPVEWRNPDTPIDFAELPAPLPAKLASGANVVDLTSELDLIDDLTAPREEPGLPLLDVRTTHEHLGHPSTALAEELLVEVDWLEGVRDLLDERHQVVFYGPPGTGKTYIARKLAADLVGPEQVKLVQLHPAYTYEDFFEGYRPTAGTGGTIGFDLRAGPLRQLVSRAIEHREQAFVLIIDEINRANLAKVFGELYFLLEYRDQAVELLYSAGDEPFSLPPNIYLIGTMNTADRSIALVDSAVRRRFAFVALEPASEPTRSLLRRWSVSHGLPLVAADLLDELNQRIDDPDFRIGPSYFMRSTVSGAFDAHRVERIWASDIVPLLEEHYYGRWASLAERFSLASLMAAVSKPEPPVVAGAGGTTETAEESTSAVDDLQALGET